MTIATGRGQTTLKVGGQATLEGDAQATKEVGERATIQASAFNRPIYPSPGDGVIIERIPPNHSHSRT